MSRRVWLRDINYLILPGGKHWIERILDPAIPIKDHLQWKRNLSDNVLMNFFRDPNDPNNELTFSEYYNGNIHVILGLFANRIASIPQDTDVTDDNGNHLGYLDPHELNSVRDTKLQEAERILRRAKNLADAPNDGLRMRDLYLDTFYTSPKKQEMIAILAEIRKLWTDPSTNADGPMPWLCIPFLNFKLDPSDPGGVDRPRAQDLADHLADYNDPNNPANGRLGFNNLDYADALFYPRTFADWNTTFPDNPDIQNRKARHRNARDKAFLHGLLSGQRVDEWYAAQNNIPYRPKSNSNGRKCYMVSGQRQCLEDAANEYCVNNNTNSCP